MRYNSWEEVPMGTVVRVKFNCFFIGGYNEILKKVNNESFQVVRLPDSGKVPYKKWYKRGHIDSMDSAELTRWKGAVELIESLKVYNTPLWKLLNGC